MEWTFFILYVIQTSKLKHKSEGKVHIQNLSQLYVLVHSFILIAINHIKRKKRKKEKHSVTYIPLSLQVCNFV